MDWQIRMPFCSAEPEKPGKSSSMKSAELAGQNSQYLTFDDPGVLAAAKRDLSGFVAGLNMPVTPDEVLHVPVIFPVITAASTASGSLGNSCSQDQQASSSPQSYPSPWLSERCGPDLCLFQQERTAP